MKDVILATIPQNAKVLVDLTLGDGGHSYSWIENLKDVTVVSFDWDIESINFVKELYRDRIAAIYSYNLERDLLEELPNGSQKNSVTKSSGICVANGNTWIVIKSNFIHVGRVLSKLNLNKADFILADLGISSRQIYQKQRGFSFNSKSAILDMRMDTVNYTVKAYDILNLFTRKRLKRLFIETVKMNEFTASKLAQRIDEARAIKKFGDSEDVKRLNKIACKIMPIRKGSRHRLHPSTLMFLALRIAVNQELRNLTELLSNAPAVLNRDGILSLLSYHHGEKETIDLFCANNNLDIGEIYPTNEEIRINRRARSAVLNIIKQHIQQ